MAVSGRLRRITAALPTGDTLSPAAWHRRHQWICRLLWAHVVALPIYGVVQGQSPGHALLEASGLLGGLALAASSSRLGQGLRSVLATIGLVLSSAVLVHFSGGLIETHFHFFVMVGVVSLYQSWRPFLVALGVVVGHHGLAGAIDPAAVYNHPAAIEHPWRWALVHGAFILAMSVACLVTWRLNEDALEGERATQRRLEQLSGDLAAAQQLAGVGSWDWDLRTDVGTWSDELYRIAGLDPDLSPHVPAFLDLVHPEDRDRVAALMAAAPTTPGGLDFQCRVVRSDEQIRVVHVLGEIERLEEPPTVRLFGTCQDVTERKALEEEVLQRAFYDGLTGLANRALLLDRLEHALAVGARTGTPTCVAYLDLDAFKSVNDTLGHRVGDQLLIEVAGRLRAAVRGADTVARFGGDEFVLLLEDTDVATAREMAARVMRALAKPATAGHRTLEVAASIGIAGTDHAATAEQLMQHADLAMYVAKRHGSRTFEIFEPGMADAVRSRALLERELDVAIAQRQLEVHYQPIVDLRTHELQGVEALVRWRHPRRGLLGPGEFIPLAEETGQIVALGDWVTVEATRRAAELQQRLGRPLQLSVNLAAPQLDGDLLPAVRDALTGAGLEPARLTLEITETCLMSRHGDAVAKLEALRALGVRIAIDDFGTGYSSLEYLKQLPIDTLKIDRTFVSALGEGREESALARAIIELAGIFGLQTVAEGIETPEQDAILRELGCDLGQGYLFSRPVPADELLTDAARGIYPVPTAPRAAPRV